MSDVSVDHRVVVEALRDHCRAQAAVGNRPQRTVKMAQANALDWLLAQVPPREPTFRDPDTGRTGSHAPPLSVAVAAEPLLVEREPQQTKYAVTATDGLGNVSTVYEIDPPASATPSEQVWPHDHIGVSPLAAAGITPSDTQSKPLATRLHHEEHRAGRVHVEPELPPAGNEMPTAVPRIVRGQDGEQAQTGNLHASVRGSVATLSEPPSAETDLQAMSRCYNETLREFAALRAQNEALRTAFARYGRHDLDCRLPPSPCDCGYDVVLRAALQDEQAAKGWTLCQAIGDSRGGQCFLVRGHDGEHMSLEKIEQAAGANDGK